MVTGLLSVNSLRPRQNGRLFADDTLKRIFLNENIRISTKNSLKFVPKGLINNIPALVLTMAWRRPGDKPLSEPMLVKSLTHICVTRPQWVKHKAYILLTVWHISRHFNTFDIKNVFKNVEHIEAKTNCHHSADNISNTFSWMKMYKFYLRFHWSLFLRFELTIFQHQFR